MSRIDCGTIENIVAMIMKRIPVPWSLKEPHLLAEQDFLSLWH